MSIEQAIVNNCTDTCVYWGAATEDGYGGKVFLDPQELACRWENINQVVVDNKGAEITSRALVFVTQDVQEEGMLYHGTLEALYDSNATDSSAGEVNNPMTINGAYIIKRFQKTPSLSGDGFLRKAYLTPSLSFGGF
jgi:hypothetical protein